MSWKIETCDFASGTDETRIAIVLMNGDRRVGTMVLTPQEYKEVITFAASALQKTTSQIIEKQLGDLLWKDAVDVFNGDTDTAMKKLGQLEINSAKIRRHSEMISLALLRLFLDSLPEHQ